MSSTTQTVDFGGLSIHITAGDEALERCAGWHFDALPRTTHPPDLMIDLVRHEPTVPTTAPDHVDGPVHLWTAQGQVWLGHDVGGTAHLHGDRLLIGGDPHPDETWRMVRQLLFSALSHFLGWHGRVALHAGMASRGDQTVLLLGPTGSGKSTAAVALLSAGWRLHSDDMVVLGHPTATTATGLPKRMAIAPDLADLAGRALPVTGALPGDPRGRLMVSSELFATDARPVTGLVMTGHGQTTGRIEPLEHRDRLAALIGSFLDAWDPTSLRAALPTLAALAAVPGWRLGLAEDPAVRLQQAAGHIGAATGQ